MRHHRSAQLPTSAQAVAPPALAAAAAALLSFICGVAVLSAANAGPADGAASSVVADDGSGGWHLEDHRVLGLWLGIAWLWDSAILLAAAFVAAADRALGYLRPPEGLHEVGRARLAGGLGVAALVVHILGWTSIALAGHRGAFDAIFGAGHRRRRPAALVHALMLNAVLHVVGAIACALDEPVGRCSRGEERPPRRALDAEPHVVAHVTAAVFFAATAAAAYAAATAAAWDELCARRGGADGGGLANEEVQACIGDPRAGYLAHLRAMHAYGVLLSLYGSLMASSSPPWDSSSGMGHRSDVCSRWRRRRSGEDREVALKDARAARRRRRRRPAAVWRRTSPRRSRRSARRRAAGCC